MNHALASTAAGDVPIAQVRGRLERARKIWRASEVLTRGLLWAVACILVLLVLALADNCLHLPGALRLVLGAAWLMAAAGSLCAWVLRPVLWRPSDQATAVYLERRLGERENLLINAVQLQARLDLPTQEGSPSMMREVVGQAAARAPKLGLNKLWDRRLLRRLGAAAGGAALLLLLYVLLLPAYAANACRRYTHPLAEIPPLTAVRVFALPLEDVELATGERLAVQALTYASKGSAPAGASVIAELDGELHGFPMASSAEPAAALLEAAGRPERPAAFAHEFVHVTRSFRFHVESGDGATAWRSVTVRERPLPRDVRVELRPPAYTGLPAVSEPSPNATVLALPGTRALLAFTPSLPLAGGALATPGGDVSAQPLQGGEWGAVFEVQREGPLALSLAAADGAAGGPALRGQVLLRRDALPTVGFENTTLNVPAAPGVTVPLAVLAADDYGLATVRLVAARMPASGEPGPTDAPFKAWTYPVPGPKEKRELFPLLLDPARFTPGETYAVYAEAGDHAPGAKRVQRSAPLLIRVLTAEQMRLDGSNPFKSIFEVLQKLLAMQTKARAKTVNVREFLDELGKKGQLRVRAQSIAEDQETIRTETQKAAASVAGSKDSAAASGRFAKELTALASGPMAQVLEPLGTLRKGAKDAPAALACLDSAEKFQREILNRLTALLGAVGETARQKPEAKPDLKDDPDSNRLRDKLADAKDTLKEFVRAEEKIIHSTQELEKKNPLDLSAEDQKELSRLAKEEQDWAKYFRDKATDLSKVPDQDFSNSGLAKEFNEVFQELQKAAQELQDKNVEIAVRNEEAGLELAKKLETNIEKWLPDTKDTQKWSMEEPKGEFDVPLADLPKELEDIIGSLVDEEKDMTDEVEDVSSSWMDSMDKGAGWDAADGNISNMSAKGVTGNRLPNEHEIGGRSGEGRSGRSHGQFVEETADGKGGRQTPSRATPDPYEEGRVKDNSQDPLGGATGGGKVSGAAAGGLRGAPPPQTKEKLERLKDTQADIRQEAEKIATHLRAYHLPSSDMEEAVRRMQAVEKNLESGKGFNLRQAHAKVVDALKDSRTAVGYQAQIDRERSRDLPKYVRQEILSGMREQAPAGYQDLLEAYYRALVERDK